MIFAGRVVWLCCATQVRCWSIVVVGRWILPPSTRRSESDCFAFVSGTRHRYPCCGGVSMGCTNSKTVDEPSPSAPGPANPLSVTTNRDVRSPGTRADPINRGRQAVPLQETPTAYPQPVGTPMYTLPAGTGSSYYNASGETQTAPEPAADGEIPPSGQSRAAAMLRPPAPRRSDATATSPKPQQRGEKRKARACLDAAWRAHVAAQLNDTLRTMGSLSNSS